LRCRIGTALLSRKGQTDRTGANHRID
jgi:hypothetical protein